MHQIDLFQLPGVVEQPKSRAGFHREVVNLILKIFVTKIQPQLELVKDEDLESSLILGHNLGVTLTMRNYMAELNIVSPVIVKLKANPDLGLGVIIGGTIYHDFEKDEAGVIVRDANGPVMVKKRDIVVVWEKDKSEFFIHQLSELEPVEVVAVRSLEEMKLEVIGECLAQIDSEERIEEIKNRIIDEMADEDEDQVDPVSK